MTLSTTANRPILLVAYGGGHVAMLAPVAQALIDAGYPICFLALTTAAAYLEKLGIPCIGYRHLPGADRAEVHQHGTRLAADLPAGGSVPAEESIAYLGLNYLELVNHLGEANAERVYAEKGRQAFLPTRLFVRWFAELQPALVIASNSPRSERAAIAAAGEVGIPSICAIDMFGLQEMQWIAVEGYANRICVLNEEVRELLLARGRKPEEVVVTGNPAFAGLNSDAARDAGQRLRETRRWNDELTTILWASQVEPATHPFSGQVGDPGLPGRIEETLRNFVARHDRFRLVIRYHPSECRSFRPGQARVDFSPRDENLSALLHAVDVVVVMTSTVGLEAHIAGRAVISVDCSVFNQDAPYSSMGISYGVQAPEQLEEALLELTRRPAANATSPELPQQPTSRFLEIIRELLPSPN